MVLALAALPAKCQMQQQRSAHLLIQKQCKFCLIVVKTSLKIPGNLCFKSYLLIRYTPCILCLYTSIGTVLYLQNKSLISDYYITSHLCPCILIYINIGTSLGLDEIFQGMVSSLSSQLVAYNLCTGTPRICKFYCVGAFNKMLPSVKFAEYKVLTFLILREKC